jgi:sugar O-acyltransferase (sialic acid O-acetyltransferase NeuD family)
MQAGERRQIALFGGRSPLVVEYEESCIRNGIAISFGVIVSGSPRFVTTRVVLELHDLQPAHLQTPVIACAFSPVQRRRLTAAALAARFGFADALVDTAAIVASSADIGVGSYVNAGCTIGAVAMIGEHVVVNRNSSIGHHSVLADFVSLGPGVTVAGNVRIGEGTVVGAGSTVLPDMRIGADAVIAAGSVVRAHVPDGAFVAGNPATEKPFDRDKSSLNLPDAE